MEKQGCETQMLPNWRKKKPKGGVKELKLGSARTPCFFNLFLKHYKCCTGAIVVPQWDPQLAWPPGTVPWSGLTAASQQKMDPSSISTLLSIPTAVLTETLGSPSLLGVQIQVVLYSSSKSELHLTQTHKGMGTSCFFFLSWFTWVSEAESSGGLGPIYTDLMTAGAVPT